VPVRVAVHLAAVADRLPVPPPHTGPAVYYAVLSALRASPAGATWATTVHDAPRHKPLSLTALLDEDDRLAGPASTAVRFEIGVLTDELTAPLLVALKEAAVLRIARCRYRIADLDVAAVVSYPQLVDEGDAAAGEWALRLVTPVAFESAREEGARRLRTLPEPEWVFGSLLARWSDRRDAPRLDSRTAAFIASHLAVTDWSLSRADHLVLPADAGRGRKELVWRGSVGQVSYRLADRAVPDGVRASLDTLARFSVFAGIGDRTNVGMGCVRLRPAEMRQGQLDA
jgi:CRISPR-associated endoribonuclease Cas6